MYLLFMLLLASSIEGSNYYPSTPIYCNKVDNYEKVNALKRDQTLKAYLNGIPRRR
jgi:hypothetical protein